MYLNDLQVSLQAPQSRIKTTIATIEEKYRVKDFKQQ